MIMEDSAMEKAGIWAPSTPEAMLPATAHGISGRFSFSSRENDAFDLACTSEPPLSHQNCCCHKL